MMMYLASPYAHADKARMQERYEAACSASAHLMNRGFQVCSPIAHSHPLTEHGAPTDWEFWKEFDLRMLKACDALCVLGIDGWLTSLGVASEVLHASTIGRAAFFMNWGGWDGDEGELQVLPKVRNSHGVGSATGMAVKLDADERFRSHYMAENCYIGPARCGDPDPQGISLDDPVTEVNAGHTVSTDLIPASYRRPEPLEFISGY